MKKIILLFLGLSFYGTKQTFAQVRFFVGENIYTGKTEDIIVQQAPFDYLIDLAYYPQPDLRYKSNNLILGIDAIMGVVIANQWYLSSGLRYDLRRLNSSQLCVYCTTVEPIYHEQEINSHALEIPLRVQYRLFPDASLSPIMHGESFLSFRNYQKEGDFGNNSVDYKMLGIRLGLGLNYRITNQVEVNVIGTWGRMKSINHIDLFGPDDYHYHDRLTIKDYQIAVGFVHQIRS